MVGRMKKNKKTRICSLCGKKAVSSYNRPNSLRKTKRLVYPNLQKNKGKIYCTRCRKTRYKVC